MRTNTIYNMDCLDGLRQIQSEKVDLVVTSPPYDNLRSYEGYTFDFKSIAKELYRILKVGGVVVWNVADATINGSETGTSFRQALYFKKVGFNLHDTMIFAKTNPIPLTHKRYEQCFEYVFVFVKGKIKTFNPIMIDCKTAGKTSSAKRTVVDCKQAYRAREQKQITKAKKTTWQHFLLFSRHNKKYKSSCTISRTVCN